jgi:hypothetical protein
MKPKLFLAALVLLSGIITGCSSDVRIENPNASDGETPSESSGESPKPSIDSEPSSQILTGGISETLTSELSQITLNSVAFAESSQYFESDYGHFVVLNLTIENTSKESLSLSSLGSFELQGSDLYIYSQAFGVDTRGSLDSTLAPGSSIRGEIVYDVPEVESFELRYKEGVFNDPTAAFNFKFSDISR